jgi:hypothetical protein
MEMTRKSDLQISPALVEAIATFPVQREVRHCGQTFHVSPFAIYAACPHCGARVKVRSFSAGTELEDVFDAVFAWMTQAGAAEAVLARQQAIQDDAE